MSECQITKALFYFFIEMSSCVNEEDIKMSLAKVQSWYERHDVSDYGSVSSCDEHMTEQDND